MTASLVGEEPSASEVDASPRPERPGRRRGALSGWGARHPLVVVAVVAGLMALGHAVWIWTTRQPGAIDPDEAGYVGAALRYERLLTTSPLSLPRAVGSSGTAPLVPLLSVPLLVVGPRDPRTAMLLLPILAVVTAVAVAGIARRLAGPVAGIAAGVVLTLLPTVIFATQTYWLGLGATAAAACSIWALLESDRLTNRWAYAYGAGIGAMLLARTMTLGFLPGMLLAGLIVAGFNRDSLLGWAKAVGAVVVVAGPWWFVARESVFGYLFSYGYGDRAELFGPDDLPSRITARVERFDAGLGVAGTAGRVVVLMALVTLVLRWRGWPSATREVLAVAAVVVSGFAALSSSANNGVWFELPVVALAVALVVAVANLVPAGARIALVVPVVIAGVLQLGSAWWLIGPEVDRVPLVAQANRVAQYEPGFEQYDERFSTATRELHDDAAADWWQLSSAVERDLRALSPDGETVVSLSGNFQLFNSNTVQLAGELEGWTPRVWVPDTARSAQDRTDNLTPIARDDVGNTVTGVDGEGVERVVVVALHDQHLFTPDAEVAEYHREAVASGWRPVARHPIPGGGEVLLMRHPDAAG